MRVSVTVEQGIGQMRIFSDTEMSRRSDFVAEELVKRGLDAAVICAADNVYYLTGVPLLSAWGRPMWCVVVPGSRPLLVGAAIERENMETFGWVDETVVFKDDGVTSDAAIRAVREALPARGGATVRVGIEERSIPHDVFRQLAETDNVALVGIGDILARARLRKSGEELDLLRMGGAVAKLGAEAFVEAVSPGVPELVVSAHAVSAMNHALAGLGTNVASSSYSYCQFGEHSLTPHLHPTDRRARYGDLVALNVFPVVWGYCVELERTFVIGTASSEQRRYLAIVDEAFNAAKKAVRPGAEACEIDSVAEQVFAKHGVSGLVRHGTGHAHGIMIGTESREEGGELREYNREVLCDGMVNSVEPGLYDPATGGYRHSDVLAVGLNSAECLTDFSLDIQL